MRIKEKILNLMVNFDGFLTVNNIKMILNSQYNTKCSAEKIKRQLKVLFDEEKIERYILNKTTGSYLYVVKKSGEEDEWADPAWKEVFNIVVEYDLPIRFTIKNDYVWLYDLVRFKLDYS